VSERVVVAMSGGVDSSVAAALLLDQGYEVVGIMLRLWAELEPGVASSNKCCSFEAVDSARAVAARLGIPFYLVNAEERFRQLVVDYFIREYAAGRTPNPCVACNRAVRFGYLLDYARALGASYLATGHYARAFQSEKGDWQLWRGRDRAKDQSYVLHMLGQEQLRHVLFPLGELTKGQVRALAAERGLPSAARQESQDLCFVADGDYRRFLSQWAPQTMEPGPILDRSGREIGRHKGLACYTIGQRSGLGIAWPEPLYVLAMLPERNALVVGTAGELGQNGLLARPVHWVAGATPAGSFRAEVQIRYRAQPVLATVRVLADGGAEVSFDRPLRDITPGQYAVFYSEDSGGERCLGGGPIERVFTCSA